MQLNNYLQTHVGINLAPDNGSADGSSSQLNLTTKSASKLYNALVGWDTENNIRLDTRLNIDTLNRIDSLCTRNIDNVSAEQKPYLESISKACKTYSNFMQIRRPTETQCLDKLSKSQFPEIEMRHSLYNINGWLYEGLTHLDNTEINTINSHYENVGYHPSLPKNPDEIANPAETEPTQIKKITLGKGNFGNVTFARSVQSNTFYALKKANTDATQIDGEFKTKDRLVPIINGVNSRGSKSFIGQIHSTGFNPKPSLKKLNNHQLKQVG